MKGKIKVVFGVNDFLVGGMQRQLSEQVRSFDKEKFDISLITLFQFPEKEDFYALLPDDLKVYRLSFKGWWDIAQWWGLYRLLRLINPQLVVSSLFFANTVFRVLRPFVGYASLAREHNTYLYKRKLHILADRFLAHFSYRIVAVSATVADFTARQEHIPREKFIVIHNGVDVPKIECELVTLPERDVLRRELGFRSGDIILLNVSRLVAQKNHQLLIDGFAEFHKNNPAYVLAIVGGGGLQEELEARARIKGVGEAVLFFGHRSDINKFYKIADLFVSTSDMEGLSNAYLEAFAAAVPILSTLTAGTDELLVDGYNGYALGESSVEEIVRSFGRIDILKLENLKRHARGTAERFSLSHTVSAYERLFEDAILQRS